MKTLPKVLFIVNGYGLGNSTRCHAVMESLCNEYEISVACSGNSLEYFTKLNLAARVIPLEQITYAKNQHGQISLLGTLFRIRSFLKKIGGNAKKIQATLKKDSYAAIFIDSDYSFLLLPLAPRPPVYSINNSANVVKNFREILFRKPSLFPQFMLEFFDYLFQVCFPQKVFVPSLRSNLSSRHFMPVPPISRRLGTARQKGKLKNILVFFSGANLYSDLDFLLPIFAHSEYRFTLLTDLAIRHPNVQVCSLQFDMEKFFATADALIINAGFSSISEAVNEHIPALVLPVENHAEQWVNAVEFERLGYGIQCSQNDILEKFKKFCAHYEDYAKNMRAKKPAARPFSFAQAISSQIN